MTVSKAAELLGVSTRKVSRLISKGEIEWRVNPLDNRQRLIPLSEIERLNRAAGRSSR